MKTTGIRSLILYFLTGGFVVGLAVLLFGLFTAGGNWALQPYNAHMKSGQLSYSGQILDRGGNALLKSENGKRVYHEDEEVRRATLHTVGDSLGYISASISYRYRSDLSGYNLITGITSPTGKNKGSDISLTLDANLCKLAQQKLNGKRGAVFLYNYKTGEILCMTSSPTFDPANPPKDLNTDETGKYDGVYLNRALSAALTPGSTFKVVTAAAAIESLNDLDDMTFTCKGSIVINGNKINCTAKHGTLHFKDALAKSCNVAFAELAVKLGRDKMTETANRMGFNQSFSIDGIPLAKSEYNAENTTDNELAWSGIGQYKDTANPAHMAILMGAVANGGTPVNPYLISSITTSFGLVTQSGHTAEGTQMLDAVIAARLKDYLRYDVTSHYGDKTFGSSLAVCAKTGTAEVEGKKPNSWIVGFSSQSSTPYAFSVVVEEGGSGLNTAGSIAAAVLKAAAKA